MNPFRPFPWFLPALLAVAARADVVPAPAGIGANAAVKVEGPLTTVNLSGPSRLEWQDFNLAAGREMRFLSQNGGAFPSLNIVRSPAAAVIDGRITADGPFYLISPGGLQVGTTGGIEAPRVLLSTLTAPDTSRVLADGTGTFSPSGIGGIVGVDGTIETSGGPLVILSETISIGGQARLRSNGGDIRLAAVDSGPVAVPSPASSLNTRTSGGSGLVNNTGWIDARRVEIVSDGFIVNGGRLTSLGQGNQIRLAASSVSHESRPDNSSVILTSALSVEGPFRQIGAVINPADGPNPSVAAGLRQTPRLSSPGFITKVEPGQTQLSTAPLQSPQKSASAVPPPLPRTSTLAARRTRSAGTVKKASFFGQQVKH
ncbi:MAG TPA: filamentous hemagglutinin N-terminal domain-containing protein [Verrucomicrobiales bacterium]|nr:filamentous hemagglutinin N-terminal domain-containing protein [Verrucomicrobiales bacterium]